MADWKSAMVALQRKGEGIDPPLFAPLVRAVASQIDAISPLELISDPTRLGKGISELASAGGIDVLVTSTPCAMEAQAFGAEIDCSQWPPQVCAPRKGGFSTDIDFDEAIADGELIAAALECTKRLALDGAANRAIVATLTGPSTLARQLCNGQKPGEDELEFASAALAILARKFGQAGADVIVVVEESPLVDDWHSLYGTIGNNAKFLKKPLVPVIPSKIDGWPSQAVPQRSIATISASPSDWTGSEPVEGASVITTRGEVAADTPLEELLPLLEDTRYELGA